MTNESKLNKNNCLNNTLVAENKIKLKISQGIIYGNILPPPEQCESYALVFNCDNNSQYIPII